MEKLNGYKTIIFFALVILLKVAGWFGFGDFHASADQQEVLNWLDANGVLIVSIAGIVLRFITTSPIFNKPQS